MIKIFLLIILFSFTLTFADDLFEGILAKIKDEKKYNDRTLYSDYKLIEEYIKKNKSLNENEIVKLNEILSYFFKCEKVYGAYIFNIVVLLKKEDVAIFRPLILKILEDPDGNAAESIMSHLDFLFDDIDGKMLIKYKYIIKKDFDFIGCLINENFGLLKYKTFRETFIALLSSNEQTVRKKMYVRLKERISFIDCLGEKEFEKTSDAEKDIEIKKMITWLEKTPDVEVAFEKFFDRLKKKLNNLTVDKIDDETAILTKNYQFLDWFPGSLLFFDPFNEKDKGLPQGIKFVIDDMQAWFDLNKGNLKKYSTYELDLLIRAIRKKVEDKIKIYGNVSFTNVDRFRKLMSDLKILVSNKDKNALHYGLNLSADLRNSIKYSRSEPYTKFYEGMLKELYELMPEVLVENKKWDRTLYQYESYVTLEFLNGKIKIDDNGLHIKVVIQNLDLNEDDIVIGKEFSFSENIYLVFEDIQTDKKYEFGKLITEMESDTAILEEAQTLKYHEKAEIIISDLMEKTKNFDLPKGSYKVKIEYACYKGKNCRKSRYMSDEVIVEKE